MAEPNGRLSFEIVVRDDADMDEIVRRAEAVWDSLTTEVVGARERPRWIESRPLPDAEGGIAHRFEGEFDTQT